MSPSTAARPIPLRREATLAICLATVAGYVDGYGLLALGTFLSFMSGNTTQAGAAAGQGLMTQMAPPAAAIGFFVVGVFVGTLVNRRLMCERPRLAALAGVGGLLGGAVLASHFGWLAAVPTIAIIALAMGLMNTTLSHVGNEPLNLTFVTGALNRVGTHLALAASGVPLSDPEGPRDSQIMRAMRLAATWTGFLGGAVLAGVLTPRLGSWTLVPPAALLVILSPMALPSARGGAGARVP